jgi:hypothetical protein
MPYAVLAVNVMIAHIGVTHVAAWDISALFSVLNVLKSILALVWRHNRPTLAVYGD